MSLVAHGVELIFQYPHIERFELFKEAISIMVDEKKNPSTGSVKIKMKLLNNQFNESLLGYNSWNDFVKDALSNTHIVFDNDIFSIDNYDQNIIPEIFKMLIDEIGDNNEWVLFTKLVEKIDYKGHGYNKFKKLALDAEKRGYVALMNKGLTWYMKKN
jgi:hypothetical protein